MDNRSQPTKSLPPPPTFISYLIYFLQDIPVTALIHRQFNFDSSLPLLLIGITLQPSGTTGETVYL